MSREEPANKLLCRAFAFASASYFCARCISIFRKYKGGVKRVRFAEVRPLSSDSEPIRNAKWDCHKCRRRRQERERTHEHLVQDGKKQEKKGRLTTSHRKMDDKWMYESKTKAVLVDETHRLSSDCKPTSGADSRCRKCHKRRHHDRVHPEDKPLRDEINKEKVGRFMSMRRVLNAKRVNYGNKFDAEDRKVSDQSKGKDYGVVVGKQDKRQTNHRNNAPREVKKGLADFDHTRKPRCRKEKKEDNLGANKHKNLDLFSYQDK